MTRAGLAYPPGERWAYSVSMDVLGAVLEAVERPGARRRDGRICDRAAEASSIGFDLTPQQRDVLAAAYADGKPAPLRIPDDGQRVHFPARHPALCGARRHPPVAGTRVRSDVVPLQRRRHGRQRRRHAGLHRGDPHRRRPIVSRETANAMMTVQTGDLPIANRGPGWAFGFGGAILTDPAAAQARSRPARSAGAACGATPGSSIRSNDSAWCR